MICMVADQQLEHGEQVLVRDHLLVVGRRCRQGFVQEAPVGATRVDLAAVEQRHHARRGVGAGWALRDGMPQLARLGFTRPSR
jgi:hypothetical protein